MAAQQKGNLLVIIDPQEDFHPPNGSLGVPGADKDAKRIVDFLNTHEGKIDHIAITLDSHQMTHIANPCYWVNEKGENPPPFTNITAKNVQSGVWKASNPDNQKWALEYVTKLEQSGKFVHVIWPYHCIIGTPGHCVQKDIRNAVNKWAKTYGKEITYVFKGQNCKTEMFSALKAEVDVEDPQCKYNEALSKEWQKYQRVFFCGQAQSHCVNWTVRDFIKHSDQTQPARTFLLSDCQSSVPTFEKKGEEFFADMKAVGVTVVESTKVEL